PHARRRAVVHHEVAVLEVVPPDRLRVPKQQATHGHVPGPEERDVVLHVPVDGGVAAELAVVEAAQAATAAVELFGEWKIETGGEDGAQDEVVLFEETDAPLRAAAVLVIIVGGTEGPVAVFVPGADGGAGPDAPGVDDAVVGEVEVEVAFPA